MPPNQVIDNLRLSLERLPADVRLKVGFSGGLDSSVLLNGLVRLRPEFPGRSLAAIHVHHGLHPDAHLWEARCEAACAELGVPLERVRIVVDADSASGPEGAARRARYRAFADSLDAGEVLCLAHHLDDQAETFLLQLLRGAGPRGLSAMPAMRPLGDGQLLRPLLFVPRVVLREYAEAEGLQWSEDPSNQDSGLDRNFLRHQVMPLLQSRWPGAARTIARAAGHQAALARAAKALGEEALLQAQGDPGEVLSCKALSQLQPDAARLAIRAWLDRSGFPPPSSALMDRIFDEVIGAAEDANPLVAWRGTEIRRYRGQLYAMPPLETPAAGEVHGWGDMHTPLELAHGRLEAELVAGSGLDASRCVGAKVEVRFRAGGERCRPAGQTQASSLKHWFQHFGVPPWERERVPLVYLDAELAAVPGRWICQGFQPAAGHPGWRLRWCGTKDRGRGV